MNKNLKPKPATITKIAREAKGVKLFDLKLNKNQDREKFNFTPGQFVELSLPGWGEAPFSLCSNPSKKERFQLLVKKVGALTRRLFELKKERPVGIRGPLGQGFDLTKLKGSNIIFISGGCGLAPIRSLILKISNRPKDFGQISLFFGAKDRQSIPFSQELKNWNSFVDTNLIVEKKSKDWPGKTGLATDLLKGKRFRPTDKAVICGPPIMIKATLDILKNQGLLDKNIFLSLERRMSCGVGVCQHCAIGSKYVCQDGPVFNLKELLKEDKNIFNEKR